jgi:hypothetical protein
MARARSGKQWRGALLGALLLPAVALAGGGKGKGPAHPKDGTGGSGRCEQVSTTIQSMESDARALAVAEGCTDVSQCKSAPVGVRACGGPRDYVVYCSATTDEDALLKELSRLQKSEQQYNEQCGVMSICIFTAEPQVDLVNGVCQKAEAAPTNLP